MATRIAINGFGRIGRLIWRAALASHPELEVVAVNDLMSPETLAHLMRYDSIHGRLGEQVQVDGDVISVAGRQITVLSERDLTALPWGEMGVDIVIESTGLFTDADKARGHLAAGARKVLISAPATHEDLTVVLGVNDGEYDGTQDVISNASCTTNCVAPMAMVLHENFGIVQGFLTTAHAYTSDQVLLDNNHRDPRRARAAAVNIVPTSTGAAKAVALVLPALKGRLDGLSLRVPVPDGSVTDLVCQLEREVTVEEVNAAFEAAAGAGLKGYLEYSTEPLVSSDIVGSPNSCTFDSKLTMAKGHLAKVVGWYDNEWGYASRLADLAALVGSRLS